MNRVPWWLWANLCSLDAPIVAVLWLWMFAEVWQISYLPQVAYGALWCSVWAVYIFDRLLDYVFRGEGSFFLRQRHFFHFRYRWLFWGLGVGNGVMALVLIFWFLPREILYYAPMMVVGVTVYLCFVVVWKRGASRMKNLLAGLIFAYGTAAFAHAYLFHWDWAHLLFSREVFYFAILCVVNIKAIDSWELHSAWRGAERAVVDGEENVLIREANASNQLWVRVLLVVLAGLAISSAMSHVPHVLRVYFLGIVAGAGALLAVDKYAARLSEELLRVLADGAVLLPVLLYVLLR